LKNNLKRRREEAGDNVYEQNYYRCREEATEIEAVEVY
jgi:hypothetical protein